MTFSERRVLTMLAIGIFVFNFLVVLVSAIEIETCICTCKGNPLMAKGLKDKCMDACGRACGGQTDCSSDCENCCSQNWCSGLSGQALGSFSEGTGCLASCKSTCELKKTVNDIISAILVASGVVAAIMIVIHGIRILTAQDPHTRDEAKKGILFVIFALAIIGLAGALVNLLMGRILMPGAPTTPSKPVVPALGCGNANFEVRVTQPYYEVWGQGYVEITEFDFTISNRWNDICRYKAIVYNHNGNKVFEKEYKVDAGRTEIFGGNRIDLPLYGSYKAELVYFDPQTAVGPSVEHTCTGTLIEEDTTIEGKDIILSLIVKNPSEIACEYKLELKDKNNRVVVAEKTKGVCPSSCLPHAKNIGEWKTELRANIEKLDGAYNLHFYTLFRPSGKKLERSIYKSIRSTTAEKILDQVTDAIISCWSNNQRSRVDVLCTPRFDVSSLDDTDVITESDIKYWLNSKGASNIPLRVLEPITKKTIDICIQYRTYLGKKIRIAESTKC